jgi:hypothetical protein
MVNQEGLQAVRTTLEADGYQLDVQEAGERVAAHVLATPEACEDCLVPKPLMLTMLQQALGVPESSIDLRYPNED